MLSEPGFYSQFLNFFSAIFALLAWAVWLGQEKCDTGTLGEETSCYKKTKRERSFLLFSKFYGISVILACLTASILRNQNSKKWPAQFPFQPSMFYYILFDFFKYWILFWKYLFLNVEWWCRVVECLCWFLLCEWSFLLFSRFLGISVILACH